MVGREGKEEDRGRRQRGRAQAVKEANKMGGGRAEEEIVNISEQHSGKFHESHDAATEPQQDPSLSSSTLLEWTPEASGRKLSVCGVSTGCL